MHIQVDSSQARKEARDTAMRMPEFLCGGGRMGHAIRGLDWMATALGAPESWPDNLRTCLRIMLGARHPMWLWWGPALINFYNDAALPILGDKHPAALGRPAHQVWPRIWPRIEGRVQAAMRGEASYSQAELLVINRNGRDEETYCTFSFSPVPGDDGTICGIVCANSDDTGRVIAARRLAQLREIAVRTRHADCAADAYTWAADALGADPRDIPFALFYRLDDDGVHARLAGACGIAEDHPAAPALVALDAARPWPVGEVIRTGTRAVVTGLGERFTGLPSGPWSAVPHEAMVLPLTADGEAAARGVLIAAANPYRRPGDGLRDFAVLAARQIAGAIADAEAFEVAHARAGSPDVPAADVLALEVAHRRRIERRQTLLLGELNHRVRNTLATVQAMAIQTLKGVDGHAGDAFIARLFALSGQHDLLSGDDWEGAWLEEVLRRALGPWHDEARPRFVVEGPPLHLDSKRALALGMAFHELAANAARFGALASPSGRVRVNWSIEAGILRFVWQETGGPPVAPPARRGFGLRLIEQGLAREIGGKVQVMFDPGGLICEWQMALV